MTRQTYERAPRLTKLATAHISKGGQDFHGRLPYSDEASGWSTDLICTQRHKTDADHWSLSPVIYHKVPPRYNVRGPSSGPFRSNPLYSLVCLYGTLGISVTTPVRLKLRLVSERTSPPSHTETIRVVRCSLRTSPKCHTITALNTVPKTTLAEEEVSPLSESGARGDRHHASGSGDFWVISGHGLCLVFLF